MQTNMAVLTSAVRQRQDQAQIEARRHALVKPPASVRPHPARVAIGWALVRVGFRIAVGRRPGTDSLLRAT